MINMKTPKSKASPKQHLKRANKNFLQLNPVTEDEIGKKTNSFSKIKPSDHTVYQPIF